MLIRRILKEKFVQNPTYNQVNGYITVGEWAGQFLSKEIEMYMTHRLGLQPECQLPNSAIKYEINRQDSDLIDFNEIDEYVKQEDDALDEIDEEDLNDLIKDEIDEYEKPQINNYVQPKTIVFKLPTFSDVDLKLLFRRICMIKDDISDRIKESSKEGELDTTMFK